ncbi:hypothetical protein [Nocardia sp. NPDC049149]|uniref:hypothetical protein n=1 Tax=Nocardia sp. NPDC049149 TaxID=3364315 RepID=UPI0037243819
MSDKQMSHLKCVLCLRGAPSEIDTAVTIVAGNAVCASHVWEFGPEVSDRADELTREGWRKNAERRNREAWADAAAAETAREAKA